MTLPLLISLPHAGIRVPVELLNLNFLTQEEIIEDGDKGAAEIYDFRTEVSAYCSTVIARAFVDLNRAPNDRRDDGVVKKHTIFRQPIYRQPLSESLIDNLLDKYYYPYHQRLTVSADLARLGIDCHTMCETSPPIDDRPGQERPLVCISNADGSCPDAWMKLFQDCLTSAFEAEVKINDPFRGGHVIRSHAEELPWLQLEISRAQFASLSRKREMVLAAIRQMCAKLFQ